MPGPWEDYASPSQQGPWNDYGTTASPTPASPPSLSQRMDTALQGFKSDPLTKFVLGGATKATRGAERLGKGEYAGGLSDILEGGGQAVAPVMGPASVMGAGLGTTLAGAAGAAGAGGLTNAIASLFTSPDRARLAGDLATVPGAAMGAKAVNGIGGALGRAAANAQQSRNALGAVIGAVKGLFGDEPVTPQRPFRPNPAIATQLNRTASGPVTPGPLTPPAVKSLNLPSGSLTPAGQLADQANAPQGTFQANPNVATLLSRRASGGAGQIGPLNAPTVKPTPSPAGSLNPAGQAAEEAAAPGVAPKPFKVNPRVQRLLNRSASGGTGFERSLPSSRPMRYVTNAGGSTAPTEDATPAPTAAPPAIKKALSTPPPATALPKDALTADGINEAQSTLNQLIGTGRMTKAEAIKQAKGLGYDDATTNAIINRLRSTPPRGK